MAVATGKMSALSDLDMIRVYAMFYGGVGSYVKHGDMLIPITIDFIDTEKYYFYLESQSTLSRVELTKGRLEDWVIFQSALRSGDFDLLLESCKKLSPSSVSSEICAINSDLGVLEVARIKLNRGRLRVIPDNAPLRHVVILE